MVPSPPSKTGSIVGNELPYSIINGGAFDVYDINPTLPEVFSIRVVVNGINGKDALFPDDNNKAIWVNEGTELKLSHDVSSPDIFSLISNSAFTINTIDVYIDGEKMTLTQ